MFPSDPRELRHNTITIEDWEYFIRDPNITRLLKSTGDMSSNPLFRVARSPGSSSHQLTPFESFKQIIKRDSSQFQRGKELGHLAKEHHRNCQRS